ncbi:MAG: hypothetical protein EZS28_056700, partial [Streblomastix strix]
DVEVEEALTKLIEGENFPKGADNEEDPSYNRYLDIRFLINKLVHRDYLC